MCEGQKCSLKRVIGVRGLSDDSMTHRHHKSVVPSNDFRERLVVIVLNKPSQDVAVGEQGSCARIIRGNRRHHIFTVSQTTELLRGIP
jgi:hypothetical protein